MDPLTLAILAAVAGSLLGGGGAYAATKSAAQKRIAELQEQLRALQGELERKQRIIAGLQQELAALQQKLADRENRIAQSLEREGALRQKIEDLQSRVMRNSRLWRKVVAMLLLRYGRLVRETQQFVAQVEQMHGESVHARELRALLEHEHASLMEAKQGLNGELTSADSDVGALRSHHAEVDAEIARLTAA